MLEGEALDTEIPPGAEGAAKALGVAIYASDRTKTTPICSRLLTR